MRKSRFFAVFMLAAATLLSGCATSRSELKIASASQASTQPANKTGPVVIIRSVRDERTFEQSPSDPSTPSLGFEGAAQATAEAKARAIGRKRNTFGKALGDVFLQNGQTVEAIVRENVTVALRDAGYNVRENKSEEAGALQLDVHIRKLWAWVQPGFWAITVHANIATDLDFSGAQGTTPVSVHVEDGRQLVTDSAWIETIEKALKTYRNEIVQKLPPSK
jgi:uncharacterized lipoprotein YajG